MLMGYCITCTTCMPRRANSDKMNTRIAMVWAFATDVGGRTFAGTATGILDCAAYIGASAQSIIFGGILTVYGNWNYIFMCIIAVLAIMVAAAMVAGKDKII